MKTSEILRSYKHLPADMQHIVEAVANLAYNQGRLDASAELTSIALETDARVKAILTSRPPEISGAFRLVN